MKLLIDGHNLIGQMRSISLADPDDEVHLVARLQRYASRTGRQITVVFDGGAPAGWQPFPAGKRLQVRFAPACQTADELIIRQINRIRDRSGWLIVSSDRQILAAAAGHGVRTQSAAEFAAELEADPPASAVPDARETPPTRAEVEAWLREFAGRRPI